MDSPLKPGNDNETGGLTGGSTSTSVILAPMLAWLPPLFFFAVLMGSPVPGFLVFMLIGMVFAWQSWRQPQAAGAFQWTRQDSWLALTFASIPLFKAVTMLWTPAPWLALQNAFWHAYYLFWPLVLLGLHRCRGSQQQVDRALALGLITTALWRLGYEWTQWAWLYPGGANLGILAQLAMTAGVWNLLALTRPGITEPRAWRWTQAVAVLATIVVLVLSTRRLELLGFGALSVMVLGWRARHWLTPVRAIAGVVVAILLLAGLVYLRWDKFALGFEQIAQYRIHGANTENFTVNSWGIRLELWRVSLAAFLDHPWLGISASARPFGMQAWGAPPQELFNHRHFHSHLLQTLVEGGLLGLMVLVLTLAYSIRALILKPWKRQHETALLGAALLAAYVAEGTASATLHYDKANALLVVMSCWVWLQVRSDRLKT